MAKWVVRVLARIRKLVDAGQVKITDKAESEMLTLPVEVLPADVHDVLRHLEIEDADCKLWADTDEWMYVFKPEYSGLIVYVKVVLRDRCVVVSFHEDEDKEEDAEEAKEGPSPS